MKKQKCAIDWVVEGKEQLFKVILNDSQNIVENSDPSCFLGGEGAVSYSLKKTIARAQQGFELNFAIDSSLMLSERRYVLTRMLKELAPLLKGFVKEANQPLSLVFSENLNSDSLVLAEDIESLWTGSYGGKSPFFSLMEWSATKKIKEKLDNFDPYLAVRRQGIQGFRSWVNAEADELTSIEIGLRLEQFAKNTDCYFEELGAKEIKAEKLNLLAAVGQASKRSPSRLYLLSNKAAQKSGKNKIKPLMFVGKGITFDTGGINVKAHENLVASMRNDMGGAALMSHVFKALVESGYDNPLVLVIPSCENLVDGESMKPGAVYKTRSGQSVVVEHTDAEGRLILADALSYATDRFTPSRTMTAATLTTAALRQFTQFDTGAHFFNAEEQKDLSSRALKWGEDYVFSRERAAFYQANLSKMADLTNMGRMAQHASMGGGSQVAAHFLKTFSRGHFNHLDIFSSTWNWGDDYPGSLYGATGAPFNSLFAHLRG